MLIIRFFSILLVLASSILVNAFTGSTITRSNQRIPKKMFGIRPLWSTSIDLSTTTVAPPKTNTDTDRATRRGEKSRRKGDKEDKDYDESYIRRNGPLEYLEDDLEQSREDNDPFHILLLAETYLNLKITVNYVSGALQFVLDMPYEDSVDAAIFAKENGIPVWERGLERNVWHWERIYNNVIYVFEWYHSYLEVNGHGKPIKMRPTMVHPIVRMVIIGN
jgi:hypothetical protein